MQLIKKSGLISLVFLANAGLQLLTQIVITRIFGTSLSLESYLAAVAIPTMLVSSIYATLNDAFLPKYGELLVLDKKKAKKYLDNTITGLLLLGLGLSILLALISPILLKFLYSDKDSFFIQQTIDYFHWLIVSLPLAMIAVVGGSVFYAKKNYFRFPVGQLCGNLIILATTLFLSSWLDTFALVIGFIASLGWQVLWLKPNKLRFKLDKNSQINLIKSWLPLIFGFLVFRSEGLIIRYFAGKMPPGYFVYLNLASKFFLMATGVATIGVQILLLPNLVEKINQAKYDEVVALVKKSKIVALIVSVITAIIVWLVTPWLLQVLFLGGKFNENDIQKVKEVLQWFVLPTIGWGIYPVFLQPLIAMKRQDLVAKIALIATMITIIVGWWGQKIQLPTARMSLVLSSLMVSTLLISELFWQWEKRKI